MTDTAVAGPDSALPLKTLAGKHGLRVMGERPTLVAYTKSVWAYRRFISSYANAKLVASFSAARLGQLWQVLTPLTNAAVYYLIFGVVLNTSGTIPHFISYLCVGLFIFMFTQSVVQLGTQSISNNISLVRALYFPRAALPIAVTITQFQTLLYSMVVLFGIVLLDGEPLSFKWLLLIPALFLQSIFSVGLGLFMARLGGKIVDMKHVMPFVMRTWMYGSAVLYSAHNFKDHLDPWLAQVVTANPMLVYIELARTALTPDAPLSSSPARLWILAVVWALVMGVAGYIYFWRGETEYGRG